MYKKRSNYSHTDIPLTGVLITNLGTPEAPTPSALRRFLKEFLSDPRLNDIPRFLWWIILHAFILTTRPAKSAQAYKQVWTDEGSPLLSISKLQQKALQSYLENHLKGPVKVTLGMRYGKPSIQSALNELRIAGANRIVVLPLYPQHAAATTASTFDAVAQTLKDWRYVPELRFINHYHDDSGYITALANSIQAFWSKNGQPKKLLFSFHGLPESTLIAGDPYFCQCQKTARLVSEKLGLNDSDWVICFQSRFGREAWLKPYASETLKQLGENGLESVDVICPGFSADCLETLEEMAVENRELFEKAGGGVYRYIPALNDSTDHIDALSKLILNNMQGWDTLFEWDDAESKQSAQSRSKRAKAIGASQ